MKKLLFALGFGLTLSPLWAQDCDGADKDHIACFTSIDPTGQTPVMIYPEGSHRFQLFFKEGEQYTNPLDGNVPGNNDFTGYIGINGSSRNGYVSVNHENTPGGVSIVDMAYDSTSMLWNVSQTRPVNFMDINLVQTSRNCSGGLTPWGTVITAEESTTAGDANFDGYEDVGWLVEIDPATAAVQQYGNGIPEKLWACGRISHENAVILNDSVTLYTGEDGGSSAVFKFIADNPMDLSSGTLYALSVDSGISGGVPQSSTATWIEIPNTTQSDRNSTRSLASSMGATNWNGVEDVEFHPLTGQIYFTAKGNSRIYRFTDEGMTASGVEVFAGATTYTIETATGPVDEPWGGGNDNLTFDNFGNLWVLQDGGRNYIWMLEHDHTPANPKVKLFASMPSGSEPTGLTFTPDYTFGFFSVQHPSGTNSPQQDASMTDVVMDASSTVVIARSQYLGAQAPIAAFEVDAQQIDMGESVNFTNISQHQVDNITWSFEGGTPNTGSNPTESVQYLSPGLYDVQLIVSNSIGADTLTRSDYIEVIDTTIPPVPVSAFTASITFINQGDSVAFTDMSSENPIAWSWNFEGGEPTSSNEQNPVIRYDSAGVFGVSLTASNASGIGNTFIVDSLITVNKTVNIELIQGLNHLKVYPNPTNDWLNVELYAALNEQVAVQLIDLSGAVLADLLHTKGMGQSEVFRFDLSQHLEENQMVLIQVNIGQQQATSLIHFAQ